MAVYLALPNVLFRPTLEALAEAGLPPHTTLVVEKPFGTDLDDAKALNELIARSFDEHHVFRIDHFLAKQTVLDILGLRFANRIFEPVWNSNHISRVDITWYESLGLEGRANYYDRAGALRDMIQNHLLQMLALVAMEPPRSITERDLRDRKVEVLRAVAAPEARGDARRRPAGPATPRAPSAGRSCPRTPTPRASTRSAARRPTPRSPSGSRTGAGRARRSGCAPARRSGKERREIAVYFKSVPHEPFDDRDRPNVLRFTLSPDAHLAASSTSTARATPSTSSRSRSTPSSPPRTCRPTACCSRRSWKATRRCPSAATRPRSCGGSSSRCCRRGSATRCRWRSTPPGRAARRARRRPRSGAHGATARREQPHLLGTRGSRACKRPGTTRGAVTRPGLLTREADADPGGALSSPPADLPRPPRRRAGGRCRRR